MNHYTRGFTLIELMISVGIFIFFTGLTLSNYPNYKNTTALGLLAHELALTVRQAQSFGLATRQFGGKYPPWGVHFVKGSSQIVMFSDAMGWDDVSKTGSNFSYTLFSGGACATGDPECVEVFRLPGDAIVQDICKVSGTTESCLAGGDSLDVVYKRPDPTANFCYPGLASCVPPVASPPTSVRIKIAYDLTSAPRVVEIFGTGQISVMQ